MTPEKMRYLAAKGHFGHEALLEPDVFVADNHPAIQGIQVAQNSPNEFGITGDYAVLGQGQESKAASTGTKSIRTKEQADLNERLLQQGLSPAAVLAREQASK